MKKQDTGGEILEIEWAHTVILKGGLIKGYWFHVRFKEYLYECLVNNFYIV